MSKVYDIIYLLAFVIYVGACMCRCKFLLFCRRSDQYNDDNPDNEIDVEARKEYIESRIIIKKATNAGDFSIYPVHGKDQDEEIGKHKEDIEDDDTSSTNNSVVSEKLQNVANTIQRFTSSIRDGLSGRVTPDESERQCPICICEFEIGDELCYSRNSRCPHIFHHSCMSEWLMKHNVCPLCRVDYLDVSDEDDGTEPTSVVDHQNHTLAPEENNDTGSRTNRRSRATAHVHLYA